MINKVSPRSEQAFRIHAGRLLFLVAFGFTAPASAALYKWTDAQGKTHYADQPPTLEAATVKGASDQAQAAAAARASLDAKDQAYQKRRKEADEARAKAEKEAAEARVQRENCDKARNNLAALQNTPRVFTSDGAGQRVYMDEAARANARAASQKALSEFCK